MNRTAWLLSTVATMSLSGCSDPAPEAVSDVVAETENRSSKEVPAVNKADSIDVGLAVGDQVPLASNFQTSGGESNLAKILENGPALLVFTRSVEWCPYCQTQLKSINSIVGELKDRGYTLYGLTYDSPDQQDRFSKNQMLQYDMLSDQNSTVIDAFGLRDPQYTEGRAAGVPYASVFAIDKDGKVVAKSVSGDFKKRPSNEQILALVDAI